MVDYVAILENMAYDQETIPFTFSMKLILAKWCILDSDGSSRIKSSPSESESYKVEPDRVRVLTRLLSYESEPSRASLDES